LINTVPDLESQAAEALRHLSAGDLAAAEQACRTALGVDAKNVSAGSALGAVLLAQGRFGEAQAVFSDLVQREPVVFAHWINLGTAQRGMRDYDQAVQAYARAAALGAQDADLEKLDSIARETGTHWRITPLAVERHGASAVPDGRSIR